MRLLPKDETFWDFLNRQTAMLSTATDALWRAARDGNAQLAGASVRIKAFERESAQSRHDLRLRLHKTFVTPIDPEDISLLQSQLDRFIDLLEAIAYRLTAYHLEPIPRLVVDLADKMHACSQLMEKAFGLLSVGDSTEELCKQILAMQEQTDEAAREGVTRLFEEEKDPVLLLKKKEIYDLFSALGSLTQDIANAVQNVSLKNS